MIARREVEHLDERIDSPNRVLLADVIGNRVWQQRRLPPIRTFDEPPHPNLPQSRAGIDGLHQVGQHRAVLGADESFHRHARHQHQGMRAVTWSARHSSTP